MKQIETGIMCFHYGLLKKSYALGFRIDKYGFDLDFILFYVGGTWS